MNELIYHFLGFCGEHFHPNIYNVSIVIFCVLLMYNYIKKQFINKS